MDLYAERNIGRSVVEETTDGMFLSLCFETAVLGDSSDCTFRSKDWISRQRRCSPSEERIWGRANPSPDEQLDSDALSQGFFDLIDIDKDEKINIFEFYYPFGVADTNFDYMLEPEELGLWLKENERIICQPYEELIDRLINQLVREFETEEAF